MIASLPPLIRRAGANAYLNSTRGETWSCEHGFRQDDEMCLVIEVPSNGYLSNTSYGSGWECYWGYAADADKCVAVEVPANGYLTESSYGPAGSVIEAMMQQIKLVCPWKCRRTPTLIFLEMAGTVTNPIGSVTASVLLFNTGQSAARGGVIYW